MSNTALPLPRPDLLAPARLLCTERTGGVSVGPYAANNLGLNVADTVQDVERNRSALLQQPGIEHIQWLDQVHGTHVHAASQFVAEPPVADALWTTKPGLALAILTADCVPVVLADMDGELVAAAHAGWRGLCAGVLQQLIQALPVPPERLSAFIGPAIGQAAFEVGPEVVDGLEGYGLDHAATCKRGKGDRFHVDLVAACRLDLTRLGVQKCLGGNWCTASDARFYSWRQETHRAQAAGESPVTGRQATLVWLPLDA